MAKGRKRTNNSNLHSDNENRFGQLPYQGLEEEEESDSNQFFNMGDGFNDADQDDFEPVSPPVQNPYRLEEEEEEPVEILNPMQGLEIEAEEEEDRKGGSDEELLAKFVQFEHPRETQRIKMFGITGTSYPLSFTNQKEIPNANRVATLAFDKVLEHAYRDGNHRHVYGVDIMHPKLDYSIVIPFAPKGKLRGNDVLDYVMRAKQSHKDLSFDARMSVQIIKVEKPEKPVGKKKAKEISGSGWDYRKLWNGPYEPFYNKHCKKGGIVPINNKDNLCLFRAVVVAKAQYQHFNEGLSRCEYEAIKDGDGKYTKQIQAAKNLMMRAGLLGFNTSNKSAGIAEIRKVQKAVKREGYQLKVLLHDDSSPAIQRNSVQFDEEHPDLPYLYIWNHHNHFEVLKSPKIFFNAVHYCDVCDKGYFEDTHNCAKLCSKCRKRGRCVKEEKWSKKCPSCNRFFNSRKCYENHLKKEKLQQGKACRKEAETKETKSTCEKLSRCLECNRAVPRAQLFPTSKHGCGERKCRICKVKYIFKPEEEHKCYMQPIKIREDKSEPGLSPGEGVDDPDSIENLVLKPAEERQGETEETRQQHYKKNAHKISDKVQRYIFWDFETTLREMPTDDRTPEEREQEKQQKVTPKEKLVKIPRKEYEMLCEHCRNGNCEEDHQASLYQKKYKLGEPYEHKPNYCVARKACMVCKDFWLSKCGSPECKGRSCQRCQNEKPKCPCGTEYKKIFEGEDCNDQFCEYLFSGEHKEVTAIAHNARGFDAQFLLQWLIKQEIEPKIINRGRSILELKAKGVRVIDSLSFLNAKLADLPKMFNEPELKKGYFPYLFNTDENYNYVGPYPDADQYCPSQMKKEERDKFYKWYAENTDGVFDMRREIKEYTESDVDILLRCCLKFNDLFFEETGVYPLEVAMTIASACNHVFRKSHLREKTIGVIPTGGYGGKDRQSAVAIEWIRWMSHQMGTGICHSMNGRENKIGNYKADGFIPETNTVFEFNGCVWHGCPKCYPDNRDRKVPGSHLSFEDAYERTEDRADAIRKRGYNFVEIWGCDWEREKAANPEIQDYLKQFDAAPDPVTGREALYGGRTNATVLWRKCRCGEKISYYDICSLYPWVC